MMLNLQYEQEYEQALRDFKKAREEYMPYLEFKEVYMSSPELNACEKFDDAEKNWEEARKKYFGL